MLTSGPILDDAQLALSEGRLADCRDHLATARRGLEAEGPSLDRGPEWARLLTLHGRLALRSGQDAQAALYAAEARAIVDSLEGDEALEVAPAALHLAANVALHTGDEATAIQILQEGLMLTARVDATLAFHQTLGAIHARAGRMEEATYHVRLAVDHAPPGADTALRQQLTELELMLGHVDHAQAHCAVVQARWGGPNASAEMRAQALALLARVLEARGAPGAEHAWESAVQAARQAGNQEQLGWLELRLALLVARAGRDAVAERRLSQAERRGTVDAALVAEVQAEIALARAQYSEARTAFGLARDESSSRGNVFETARLDVCLADVAFAVGDRRAALAHLESALGAANQGGFEVSAAGGMLALGLERGLPETSRYARDHEVRATHTECDVLLDTTSGTLTAFGQVHALGDRAVVVRLIKQLLQSRPESVTARRLCQRLWRDEGFNDRTFNRLKVHIHRARTLIGTERDAILTDGGPGKTSYRWSPAVSAELRTSR